MKRRRARTPPPVGHDASSTSTVTLTAAIASTSTNVADCGFETRGERALLVPFDDCDRPLLVDVRLFDAFECRTALLIKHEPAHEWRGGTPAWHVSARRSVLIAFVEALVHHEIVVPKDVEYHEVVRYLNYEGVAVPGSALAEVNGEHARLVMPPPACVAARREALGYANRVAEVANAMASAVVEWRRLWLGVRCAAQGQAAGFAASGGRVWIRLSSRPDTRSMFTPAQASGLAAVHAAMHTATHPDALYMLARAQPRWLVHTLRWIGATHMALVKHERDACQHSTADEVGVELDSRLLRAFAGNVAAGSARLRADALLPRCCTQAEVDQLEAAGIDTGRLMRLGQLERVSDESDIRYVLCVDKPSQTTGEAASGDGPPPRKLLMRKYSTRPAAFDRLSEACRASDALGPFACARIDGPRALCGGADEGTELERRVLRHANAFARTVLAKVTSDNGRRTAASASDGVAWAEDVLYARRCVQLAERLVREAPDCALLFGSALATTKEKSGRCTLTTERKALAEALQRVAHVRVLEWSDEDVVEQPLVFPPHFYASSDSKPHTGPCLLIEV